jgi:signal transduction histidine kinase
MVFERRQRDAAWAAAILNTRSRTREIVAWTLAVAAPVLIAALTQPVRGSLGLSGYLFCALVVVVATALVGGVPPALTAVLAGSVAGAFVFALPYESARVYLRLDNAPLIAFIVVGTATAVLVASLTRLLEQQTRLRQVEAALRRVATLVARAAPAEELFAAATAEVGALLGAERVSLGRFETDGTLTILSGWAPQTDGDDDFAVLALQPKTNGNAPTARFADARLHTSVDAPIVLESRVWGMMVAGSSPDDVMPADSAERLRTLTDLLATAIANAESRNELTASRARVVAAADLARRQIERDLHDGAQQQLVSLALGLRAAQTTVPSHLDGLSEELSRVAEGLSGVQEELREIARGIHPAILAQGGVGPALRTLARRCALPVNLELLVTDRLVEHFEVAIYYIVAEALTNAVKHANASAVNVCVEPTRGVICISVCDDGIGGADPRLGSGLLGLKDRVGALGGTIAVDSPPGAGTRLEVDIPIGA